MSERHREALAHLLYGVEGGGGFVLLTGEIGAGKTTVCRCFLEQVPPRCHVAYIFNPKLTVPELLQTICEEFHLPDSASTAQAGGVKENIDRLNAHLLRSHAEGHNNVLIIDEAQNLSLEVLEQLRLLTNLETNERKLLQIILIGQPELRDMLERPDMEQLAQRVIARYHLDALSAPETAQYIQHRLKVAGLARGRLFDKEAMLRIHRWTRGVPRRINLLCDRALLGAYAENQAQVTVAIVDKAASEVFPRLARQRAKAAASPPPTRATPGRRTQVVLASLALVGMAGMGAALWLQHQAGDARAQRPVAMTSQAATASGATAASAVSASADTVRDTTPAMRADVISAEALMQAALPDENAALRQLMTLWQVPGVGGDVCANAWRQGLMCHLHSGGLPQVRQLERPVVLRLQASGQRGHALLTGLDTRYAYLQNGDQTVAMPLGTLATLWRGDFVTLWRTPPGYRAKLLQGQRSATVGWVAAQLARLDGHTLPADAVTTFDAALEARVQAFQLAQGLAPDGVVGATTLMQLNRAAGVPEPSLHTPPASPASLQSSPSASQPAHVLHP
ncbi:MAG: AAA family ATPase [Aquabacterium sp.]|uniref:ExeA family protein n=1 Tax=Aquabacterium sp. TaxID=1872578 RepID=UPI002A35DF70|nr:AAA family ATPase [Aquabacterium sp.]MDX9843770.1 AAA family ATPase [Aquabacterium sp.]